MFMETAINYMAKSFHEILITRLHSKVNDRQSLSMTVIVSGSMNGKMKLNDADSRNHLAKHYRLLQGYNALHVHDACTRSAASKQPG
jgi:hypothetical protein